MRGCRMGREGHFTTTMEGEEKEGCGGREEGPEEAAWAPQKGAEQEGRVHNNNEG